MNLCQWSLRQVLEDNTSIRARCALADDRHQQMERKPAWRGPGEEFEPDQAQCSRVDHVWVAYFLMSGRLAYWKCEGCGLSDREAEPLPEPLDPPGGWVKSPPKLTARGRCPPASARRWAAAGGSILSEGDPSSTHFFGEPIPGLVTAHTYVERDQNGEVLEIYAPSRERTSRYGDHYTLTRFQVVDSALVRFESHCFEESTFDIPNAAKPRQTTVLSGLVPLRP